MNARSKLRFWILTLCLAANPSGHAEADPAGPRNKATLTYEHDWFDQSYSAWNQVSAAYLHRFDAGSVIGRVNEATRFNTTGVQFEVDAYPKLWRGSYLYLNYGYSSASIFPHTRLGAEIYQSLSHGWEASLGQKRLDFAGNVVVIDTVSLAKYLGRYYVSVRGTLIPEPSANSTSFNLIGRRYFSDVDYVGLNFGLGKVVTLLSPGAPSVNLKESHYGADGYLDLGRYWYMLGALTFENEEIRPNVTRHEVSVSVGVEKRF